MSLASLDVLTTIATTGAPFLAVDVRPDVVTGTFSVDVSYVDGEDLLGWPDGGDGDWVNVVCDVLSVQVERGMVAQQGPLAQARAGLVTLQITDTERRFDPLNNSDSVHKGTDVRLRAWGYRDGGAGARWDATLFTGQLDAPQVRYLITGPPRVTLTALDIIGPLAAWSAEGRANPGVGLGDNLRQRVARVLAEVGRGTIAADSDELYEATLAPTILDKPWQIISNAATAELGRVWVNTANELVVRARDSQLDGTVRGTLSDQHGEAPLGVHCCLADAVVVASPERIANRALAARRVPTDPAVTSPPPAVLARVDDAYSQARYDVAVVDQRSLDVATDAQAQAWAQSIVLGAAEPGVRVDEVTPWPAGNPYTAPADPNVWEAVCRTDIGDRWLYRMHPELGAPVARALGIIGVALTITPAAWEVVWTTVDAPEPGATNPSGYFTVGLSEVDGPDVLALFGGQPPGALFGDVDGGGATQGMVTDTLDGGTASSTQYERTVDGGGAAP